MFINIKRLLACTLVALTFASGLQAGILSDEVADYIASRPPDEFVRVVIIPVSDHNPAALKASLVDQYRSRADRHRVGIERLKAVAEKSQADIKTCLENLLTQNVVRNMKHFWVTNLIEAEIIASEIPRLAENPTVSAIELYPTIVSLPLIPSTRMSLGADAVQPNLKSIKADSAWMMGYNGSGRIICSFDSGVEGVHPALAGNYHGNKGYPASQCWFSPVDSSVFPHTFLTAGNARVHGTHTTGIIVGHNDATGDTIGVAPGADWIAAVAIDVPGSSIFQSFQWAADPDGDPNTVDDIPDVINHSWGVPGIGCADLFWEAIDNLEALGVVNIFSAGNEGPALYSLRNPANRAMDSLTNFAIGATDISGSSIWSGSSRGPSDCDSMSIKPNIVAPGMGIYSSVLNGLYNYATGTSGAAPHVSGAVAILRQKNPDATVDEIKTALLNSAHDRGTPGPDNTYGWGFLDIMEALRQLDQLTEPSLQIANLAYPEINPGDIVNLNLALKNVGTSLNNVSVEFANPEPGLTVFTDVIGFGTIARNATVYGNHTLDLEFDLFTEPGRFYSVDMIIHGTGGFVDTKRLNFFVGAPGERNYFHHDTARVKFTISNFGAFGFYGTSGAQSFTPLGFDGYQLDRDTNDLYEGALLIGVDSMHVSDCAKNIAQEPDNDFAVSPGGSLVSFSPGPQADQQTVSSFNDHYAEHPIGLEIQQRTYGWAEAPDNNYIILEYIITNSNGDAVNGIHVGLYLDWDIRNYSQNHGSFVPELETGYLCWSNTGDSADFRGVRVLNAEGLTNHYIYLNYYQVYNSSFTEGNKYRGLVDNSRGSLGTNYDVSHVTATGPFNLDVGESDTAAFAIIGGADWTSFVATSVRAAQKYSDFPTDIDDDGALVPGTFALYQNYPNPFNPVTTLSFTLPHRGEVEVEIFDILGRTVTTLHRGTLSAGRHELIWDGTGRNGAGVASGIYLYRITFDGSGLTRKMMLMK